MCRLYVCVQGAHVTAHVCLTQTGDRRRSAFAFRLVVGFPPPHGLFVEVRAWAAGWSPSHGTAFITPVIVSLSMGPWLGARGGCCRSRLGRASLAVHLLPGLVIISLARDPTPSPLGIFRGLKFQDGCPPPASPAPCGAEPAPPVPVTTPHHGAANRTREQSLVS